MKFKVKILQLTIFQMRPIPISHDERFIEKEIKNNRIQFMNKK